MTPRSLKTHRTKSGFQVHFFDTGVVATEVRLEHVDVELQCPLEIERAIVSALSDLPEDLRIKVVSESKYVFDPLSSECKRHKEIEDIGYMKHGISLIFEKDVPSWQSLLKGLLKNRFSDKYLTDYMESFAEGLDLEMFQTINLKLKPDERNTIHVPKKVVSVSEGLRMDNKYCAVLKLQKLGNFETNLLDLSFLRESFPDDYKIVLGLQRVGEKETRFILGNKSKREESGQDLKSQKKFVEAQRAIEEVDHQGKKLFRFEFTVILNLNTHEELIKRGFEAKNSLKSLGDFSLENKGAIFCFLPTLPGARPHIEHKELVDRLPSFFPLAIRGRQELETPSPRSFVFHRTDHSLDQIDLFDPSYDNFSGIVVGRSGRGKSVFVNTLQQSILNDRNSKIILVDVKGSHTNMVKSLKGKIHKISPDSQTAISPFNFLRENSSKEVVEIVVDFIEKLILEDHERSLLRQEQALLEESLITYVDSKPSNPSLDDFVRKVKNIPRSDSLKRWIKGGIYEGVFAPYGGAISDAGIQYFDFTNIVTAQKGGVGPAIMSAILAHYHYLLIAKKTEEKILFFADELPFFLRSCFSTFCLLMKNIRKLNGSLLLIAQNLSDLVIDGDTSLIDQTDFRVFFSKDGGNPDFKRVSGLSESSLAILESLSTVNGKFSQFILRDNGGERTGKLILSRNEYFRSTTHASDKTLIEKLCKAFGTKDENTVIEIVADIERNFHGFLQKGS